MDHPATRQWKRARLRELQIAPPSNLVFVPLDFETHTLAEALRAGGYRPKEAAFFSWLGTTRYLTEESVFRTLRDVASVSAPGSEIVFDYSVPDEFLDEEGRQFLAVLKGFGAASGEPWLSLFAPASLAARVEEVGFAEVWDFSPEEANARYFAGRMDGLRVPSISHLMKARVGCL